MSLKEKVNGLYFITLLFVPWILHLTMNLALLCFVFVLALGSVQMLSLITWLCFESQWLYFNTKIDLLWCFGGNKKILVMNFVDVKKVVMEETSLELMFVLPTLCERFGMFRQAYVICHIPDGGIERKIWKETHLGKNLCWTMCAILKYRYLGISDYISDLCD